MHQEYNRLIAPIENQMLRSIWGVTQNADDAEEALQEALEKVWRKLSRIQRHPNPHALVLRIAINSAYDALRRRIRRERRRALAEVMLRHTPPVLPEEALARKEQESAVLRAIGRLSRNQSKAVMMRLVQGHSYGEIAEILGCSAATARKHVERGRRRLQELLVHLAPKKNGNATS